jgi:hypothetical protein
VFAINHAATALLLKRRYPELSLVPMLVAVQAMELVWVALNYLGVERTTTERVVRYVGDIHLAYMPFSHSVATMVGAGVVAWAVGALAGRPRLGAAVGIGIVSHLVLDLVTHNGDIALAPGVADREYGTFLYARIPAVAFLLELAYGLVCWRVFRGGKALLAVIVGFNLANVSLFFQAVPGPEQFLAGRPALIVTVILAQILVTLWAIWFAAGSRRAHRGGVRT